VELCEGFAPYRPLFIEDPLKADNLELYHALRERVSTPIGTGEKLGPIWDYSSIIEQDTIDYVRTDICNCGGITSMKKIAAYAEAHTMEMVPQRLRRPAWGWPRRCMWTVPCRTFSCRKAACSALQRRIRSGRLKSGRLRLFERRAGAWGDRTIHEAACFRL
jgi:hypothetical protein